MYLFMKRVKVIFAQIYPLKSPTRKARKLLIMFMYRVILEALFCRDL